MDSTYERYDCIGSRHADGDGIVCIELWSKWHAECAFTELFWIEYYAHIGCVQYTGNTWSHYWHSDERMFGCCVDLQHSRCTWGDELLVDSTCQHDDLIGSGQYVNFVDDRRFIYRGIISGSRC